MTDFYAQVFGSYNAEVPFSFGVHITSTQTRDALVATWANAWAAAWTDGAHGLQTLYPVSTELQSFSVSELDALYLETFGATVNAVHAGTSTDDSLPFLMSTLVSERSPSKKRSGRGRFFLPAMIETVVNTDVLTPAAQTRTSAAVNQVKSLIEADGSTIFVVNKGRPHPKPPLPVIPPGPKYVITKWEVSDKPARQSRRVRKVKASYV